MNNLTKRALRGMLQLEVVMALVLFVPGGLRFWQGWVYWIVFSTCVVAVTAYFLKYDPHLIEGRLAAGPRAEQETTQKIIQAIAGASFISLLVVPALDH